MTSSIAQSLVLRVVGLAFAAFSCISHAQTIRSFDLSADNTTLLVHLSDGSTWKAPYTHAEQAGFSNAQRSANAQYIGWTVTFDNCCTSYPLPRAMAIADGRRIIRLIAPNSMSIFDWHFSADGTAIVYERELPHGNSPHEFRMVRISDGKQLQAFDCDVDDRGSGYVPERYIHPPQWTRATELDCPAGALIKKK